MTIILKQNVSFLDNDLETVIGLFLNRIGGGQGILLESAEVDGRWGRFSLAAGDFLFLASCREGRLDLTIHDSRLEPLKAYQGFDYLEGLRAVMAAIELRPDQNQPDFPPITRALYGYLGYEAAGLMEKRLGTAFPPNRVEGIFGLPGNVYLFDHTYNQLARLSLFPGSDAPVRKAPVTPGRAGSEVRLSLNRESYLKAAGEIKELIGRGEIIEAVLSTRFSAEFTGDLFDVYRRLRRLAPSPYMFFLRLPGIGLAASSPEVLVSCDRNRLRLCPVAGSRPRGQNLSEDSLFEEELYSDPQEQAEHAMLVDLGRNDLGRVAASGSVRVDRLMEVERFSHAMHLTSRLSARLAEGRDALDVLTATFPSGSISGTPKVRAMEIIAGLEPEPRGPFGGALGWLGLDKDQVSLDLGLTNRGFWSRQGRVFWQTGAGLAAGSDPERQWRQCLRKGRVMLPALSPEGSNQTEIESGMEEGESCSF